MKTFKRIVAVLLLMAFALMPVTGLGDAALEMLKVLMEMKQSEDIPVATGISVYDDVDEDTSNGILCLIAFMDEDDTEDSSGMITISGINTDGKYEIRMYTNLSFLQMLYYSYVISSSYSIIRNLLPADAAYNVLITYGEDGMILINDEETAETFNETILSAVEALSED